MAAAIPFVVPFLADTSGPFLQLLAIEHTAQTVQAWIQDRKDVINTIKRQAVDQEAPFDLIYEDIRQLQGDISGFKRLLQSNEASRAHWRRVHMGIWRRTCRPLKVVDLPTEILIKIFGHFKHMPVVQFGSAYDEPPPVSPDVASLRSTRLTCRAFCDTASKFLLPIVDISFTRSSLERLEGIANHSKFSKGVRILRLHANPYNSLLVSDRNSFIKATNIRIHKVVRMFENEERIIREEVAETCRLEGVQVSPDPHLIRANELRAAWEQAGRSAATLAGILRTRAEGRQGPMTHFEHEMMKAVDEAYREYGRMYLEQWGFMNDRQVLTRIVIAVRKMPCFEELIIPDAGAYRWEYAFTMGWKNRLDVQKYKSSVFSTNPFWDLMIQAGDSEDALPPWRYCRPFPLLQKLPSLLQAANHNLTRINVNLPQIPSHHMEALADHHASLQESCRNLTEIRITVTATIWTYPLLAPTYSILDKFLSSPGLEVVWLCYRWKEINELLFNVDERSSIGPVLAKLPWNKIREFMLEGFPITVEELRQIIEKVPGKIYLELWQVYLLDGSWEEVLDILRGRVDGSSQISDPRGTQLDAMSETEAQEFICEFNSESRAGWYSDLRCPGPASFYIRGGDIPNPLRSAEDSSDDTQSHH